MTTQRLNGPRASGHMPRISYPLGAMGSPMGCKGGVVVSCTVFGGRFADSGRV
jgi:hypothetical protein